MRKIKFAFAILAMLTYSQGFAQKIKISGGRPTAECTTLSIKSMLPIAVDTTAGRNAANNDLAWENGDVIKVKFMNGIGSESMRAHIKEYAKTWETYANITFQFVADDDPNTNMRVMLGSMNDHLGHNSYIGTGCNSIPQDEQTVNLDTSDFIDYDYFLNQFKTGGPFVTYVKNKRSSMEGYTYSDLYADVIAFPGEKEYNYTNMRGTTMHEFGHALGLLHEQSYPNGIKWNKDTVYKYYALYQNWDKEKVDNNVLKTSDVFYTNGMSYDPKSIMHYSVEAWQTLDGFSVGENEELSNGDKTIIAALYPKDKKISTIAVPKIEISDIGYGEVKVDEVRKGISIKPDFKLKTSALLGEIYVVARLTTEDGLYYIPTINENYSWNKNAATYVKVKVLPSSSIKYNKDGKNGLELFFPFSEMPDLKGQKVKVELSVYQDDLVNNRVQKLYFNFLSSPLSVPTK